MTTDLAVGQFFDNLCEVAAEDACWIWQGKQLKNGYGFLAGAGLVHRLAFRLAYGPIPKKLHVCHRCDIKLCVNPEHLFLGTSGDNLRDASKKGRLRRTPEMCAKLSTVLTGVKKSPEACARLSILRKGKPGHPQSAETRIKLGIAMKGKQNTLGYHHTPETKAKQRLARLAYLASKKQQF